jgi:ectoine hydroxylase-related dioxygenase (phytanoyl-CoA dioxygenase family)
MSEEKHETTAEMWQTSFHRYGFKICRQIFSKSECESLRVSQKKLRFKPIFNHDQFDRHDYNDNLRKQSGNLANQVTKSATFSNFVTKMQALVHQNLPLLKCHDFVAIQSLPGCREQPMHRDYDISSSAFDNLTYSAYPCAAIIALQDGTRLPTWPILEDGSVVRYVVELNEGDMLWFRGDLLHAGAEYEATNERIHVFLDSPRVKRTLNTTSIIEYDNNKLFEQAMNAPEIRELPP